MTGRVIDFDGRHVLVTGAGGAVPGRGMGRAIAAAFADAGAQVSAADIDPGAAEATAASIRAAGGTAVAIEADVTSSSSVDAMVTKAEGELGPVEILINHAGGSHAGFLADTDDDTWHKVLQLNLDGPFFTIRRVLPRMLSNERGIIVNTVSVAGLGGGRGRGVAYTAAKHGLVGLTRHVAVIYGPAGIRCTGVAPGPVRSGSAVEAPLAASTTIDPRMDAIVATVPRLGTPEEVANVTLFLASDQASLLNGVVVAADAGWLSV